MQKQKPNNIIVFSVNRQRKGKRKLVTFSMVKYLLFFGGISLIAPGFSLATVTLLMSILAFFSEGKSLGGGEVLFSDEGREEGNTVPGGVVEEGFLRPLREGGGGASSVRPWERNCDL